MQAIKKLSSFFNTVRQAIFHFKPNGFDSRKANYDITEGECIMLHESGQMYLEAIYVLLQKNDKVRAIDVGAYLGYSKPSVSRALGILKDGEYIVVDGDGHISLTDSGKRVAEQLYERHTVLTNMLMALGVDEENATEDACRIEHVISDKSFDAIKEHFKGYKN